VSTTNPYAPPKGEVRDVAEYGGEPADRLFARNGQTIAKKIVGIKVVRSDGSPASLGRIFWLRNVVNGLLGIIPLYGLIDILFIFGEQRQCLHDKIADTIVVKA